MAALVVKLLQQKAPMLSEYFAIDVDQQGCIAALPRLIDHYVPDLLGLPQFVLRLARDVEWGSETECFRSLAQVRWGKGGKMSMCGFQFFYVWGVVVI